ncbi:MAG: hypothetical protein KJ607_09550, partial [Bacteroidetes bacterium]|nr:hypothetical protein [Bacteroidota bacterium]
IARLYNLRADRYMPLEKSTFSDKWHRKTAADLCRKTIDKYPGTSGAAKCTSLLADITRRSFTAGMEQYLMPDKTFPVHFDYRNLSKAYLRVASIDREKIRKYSRKYYGTEYYEKLMKDAVPVKDQTLEIPDDGDHNRHSVDILLDGLPLGTYVLFVANNPEFSYESNITSYTLFSVTGITYTNRQISQGGQEFTVFDRTTGAPLEGVTAQTWYTKYDYPSREYRDFKGNTFITDKDGYFSVTGADEDSRNFWVEFTKDADYLNTKRTFYSYNYDYDAVPVTRIFLFTDRAIYRPGQTVYFKGLVVDFNKNDRKIVAGYSTEATLLDVNYQKVTSIKVKTNEFGTFSGSFQLPLGLLTGAMQIRCDDYSVSFSMEEYKRPKFEVEIKPFAGNYIAGDSVEVKGIAKSFAGSNITDAQVSYQVVRSPVWRGWWYWNYFYTETVIAHGTTTTDEKGEYTFSFKAVPDLSLRKHEKLSFNYRIQVDVTDLNGETRSNSGSVQVGYTALEASLSHPAMICRTDTAKYNISTVNLNGQFIPANGTIRIFRLKEPQTALRERALARPDYNLYSKEEWTAKFPGNVYGNENDITSMEKGEKVFETDFDTKKQKKLELKGKEKWETGYFTVETESKDAFGNPVTNRSWFTLYDDASAKTPCAVIDWFTTIKNKGEPGETAVFLIGSSMENVRVLFETEHDKQIISKEWIVLDNSQKKIEIPIKEEHRGNVAVYFTFIRDSRLYTHSNIISVPYTDKQLDLEFMTFRNKLYPGEKEEWRIKIKDKNGEKAAAEMLATLYDASLDEFRYHSWYFSIYNYYYATKNWYSDAFATATSNILKRNFDEYVSLPSEYYNSFNWHGFSYYSGYYLYKEGRASGGRYMTMSAEPDQAAKPGNGDYDTGAVMEETEADVTTATNMVVNEPVADGLVEQAETLPAGNNRQEAQNKAQEDFSSVQVRKNFNETAFFYPHLVTDENGEVTISFTIPEALTKWKMLGFAHTKDLKFGLVDNELITQKDLMVLPNAPRFFRENDLIEFPVKISNVSEKDLEGKTQLELFDAISMKPVEGIFAGSENPQKDFSVKAGQNVLVTWKLKIPESVQAVTYRVVAKSGNFSDGEENVLPVLTNRMLVTESLPLPIRGNETKTFEFTKLINSSSSSTLRHQQVTLEFTSNPAWYAVQALQYLMEYPYECTEQTFSRYYANSLAAHIVNNKPKIKKVFDAWRDTPKSEALLSNLEKNQELKSLLLEETPWVLNAQNESERKRSIGLLFDLNKMASELNRAMKKLIDAQSSNGGWPWFEGMPESRYITQHIVCGMGHLENLGVTSVRQEQKVWNMIEKAVGYLDVRIREDYDDLKKIYTSEEMKEKHIGGTQIHYLYARSFFRDIRIPSRTKEAFDYFTGQAEKYWLSEEKYTQGMIALALHRFEIGKAPKDIVKSLREHLQKSDEMGMYFKEVIGWYWYQAPIERQALMIEVFDEVGKDSLTVEELKIWLLKQKQTQDWKTTKATVEAVYALLLRGADWLDSDKLVNVQLGDLVVDPKKMDGVQVEAGTGYFKTSWKGGEIKPEMGNIKVTKSDPGIAWGALYWQYFEQLDKITPHETPLSLK